MIYGETNSKQETVLITPICPMMYMYMNKVVDHVLLINLDKEHFLFTKCLHNRPDGYILNDRHFVCERHHACAEVSSKPNKNDDDQTCERLGRFNTKKHCRNCSFHDDDTQGFQNILAMCLLRPVQRNKLKNPKTCLFSSALKSYVKIII